MTYRAVSIAVALSLALSAPAAARQDPVKRDRAALKALVDDIVQRSALAKARVGLKVVSLDDGATVVARDAEDLLNPASNVKLFTSAAALVRLGTEYRFDTEFLIDKPNERQRRAPLRSGEVRHLYVRGKGDPSITSERLWGIANELYLSGLRTIQGDLVLDDSFFDEQREGPGFEQEGSDRAYMAPAGALSLNANAISVHIYPADAVGGRARVELDPPSGFFVVENNTRTTAPRTLRRLWVTSVPLGDRQKVVVSGRIPVGQDPAELIKKIDNPTLYFGRTLEQYLGLRGIKLRGKVRRGAAPADGLPLYVHQSETLDLVLKRVNKNSSNFTAEQLIKVMGAQATGRAGSWAAGISVVEDFLAQDVGLPRGTYVMKNGSGLNDTNRFSASQICVLLRYMWKRFPLAPEYLSSLGIAGKDGTLHYRMEGTEAAGRLRAKTGTLENVSALSGYVQAVGGERFAFSIMANDFPGRTGPVVSAIDAVGTAIAGYGRPMVATVDSVGQVIADLAGSTANAVRPTEDIKPRVTTYLALGNQRDKRNVTFLRTALRAERDPALRAVIAEAAYLSDPGNSLAARGVVETLWATPEVFGRLRQVGRELKVPTPGLASLERIAAEGDGEAMSRLVEIFALGREDAVLGDELLEPASEVARNAPDELIAALRAAQEATREAALDLLARSLSRAAEPEHPFPVAVKRSQEATDPPLAEFARTLGEGLAARIAAIPAAARPQPASAPGGKKQQAKTADLKPGG